MSLLETLLHKKNQIQRILTTHYYRMLLGSLGRDSWILGSITIYSHRRVHIGSHCIINAGVLLNGHGGIRIGNHVRISPRASIASTSLIFDNTEPPFSHSMAEVVLEDGVWLASGCIVLPGVRIGERAVVAAGAVVNNNVQPFSVVGGIPARQIRIVKH